MRKFFIIIALVLIHLSAIAGSVNAAIVGLGFDGTTEHDGDIFGMWNNDYKGYKSGSELWSGYLITIQDGNDNLNKDILQNLAAIYLGVTEFEGVWEKVDQLPGTSGFLSATENSDGTSGTWTLTTPYEIGFYSVKAGSEFALYYVHPYQSSGNWSTVHLTNKKGEPHEISHLSAGANAVPVPGTIWLLASSLFCAAGLRKRNRRV